MVGFVIQINASVEALRKIRPHFENETLNDNPNRGRTKGSVS